MSVPLARESTLQRPFSTYIERFGRLRRRPTPSVHSRRNELDASTVAATAAFLASPVQPFQTASQLDLVKCRTMVVRGIDPSHPAEVADLYAAHIPGAILARASVAEIPEVVRKFLLDRAP
jgi:hypothetical protein